MSLEAMQPSANGSVIVAPVRSRFDAIDWLRGLVMVLMALDHTRDFFSNFRHDPLDLTQTSAALFLTRWVTHFCAPVFVFLAGTGAFLTGARGKSKPQLAWFLVTRGLWLFALEFTLVHLGWFFNFDYNLIVGQVIWAIGGSMILLAALVALPAWLIGLLGAALIGGLGVLDGIPRDQFGAWSPVWQSFVSTGMFRIAGETRMIAAYPILPWLGILLAGYGFGQIWLLDRNRRRLLIAWTGLALILLFVALRWSNLYGDPRPWQHQSSDGLTLLSFLNCNKYPPSLLYVSVTLGPALLLLAAQDREHGPVVPFLITFGRVPLFYYLLHVPIIHVAAIVCAWLQYGDAAFLFQHIMLVDHRLLPADYGYDLPIVYAATLGVIVLLYPLCRWFAGVKSRSRAWWLGYL